MPDKAFEPDQPPEAVQAVALVAVQFNVALLPLVMALGPTLKVTMGAAGLMETVADWVAVPPGPEQASVKVALAESTPVDCDPVRALAPDQPPEAEQAVALEEVQASVELVPLAMLLGLTEMLTVGGVALTETVADWLALPPAPVQVNV